MMVGFASNRVYTLSPRCAARSCFVGRIVPGGVGTRLNYGIQPANGGTEQQWKLELVPNEDGWYYIVAVAPSGGVLDVEGAKTNDRATTIVHIKNGGDNQKWRIESCGNGYFVLRPKHAQNKVLELYEANTANGAQPSLYSANGSVAQQWILRPIAAGIADPILPKPWV